jgi:hypothetical protein
MRLAALAGSLRMPGAALGRRLRVIPVRRRLRVAAKVDFKRELGEFYAARRSPAIVEAPELVFVMIDGHGDPNTSGEYRDAVSALFSVSYAARFALKRAGVIDFAVMPLEGLWWASDMSAFSIGDKSAWDWTMLIMQPDEVPRTCSPMPRSGWPRRCR